MTIAALRQVSQNGSNTTLDLIGRQLWLRTWIQTAHHAGAGAGLSVSSCAAGVAIVTALDFGRPIVVEDLAPFNVLFGQSRLATGLDPDFNAFANARGDLYSGDRLETARTTRWFRSLSTQNEHAEQTAILLAANDPNIQFWSWGGMNHIFIDYAPCSRCHEWLNARPDRWCVHYRSGSEKDGLSQQDKERLIGVLQGPDSSLKQKLQRT